MPPNIVAGRPLAEWETLIRSKIDGHLKNERFDSLVYEITEVEKIENYVIKKKGQDRIVQDPSGTTTFLAPIVAEPATPTKIELTAPIKVLRSCCPMRSSGIKNDTLTPLKLFAANR